MMVPFVILSVAAFVLLALVGQTFLLLHRKTKELALLQDTCDTWRETAERRAKELMEAWEELKEHREKAAKWDDACNDIVNLQHDRGCWRALRREIADCCGKSVPEDQEPPNHGDCVAMLRWLQDQNLSFIELLVQCREMLQKYVDATTQPEPLSPAMGVGEKAAEVFHSFLPIPKPLYGRNGNPDDNGPESLIPTADSVENAIGWAMKQNLDRSPLFVRGDGRENKQPECGTFSPTPATPSAAETCHVTGFALPADFKIDAVLARDEARSNSYG